MATEQNTRGGSHEEHVKAGQQSHKTAGDLKTAANHDTHEKSAKDQHKGTQGGTHEQHVKAGQQSHKSS
jgi:hypothetical protein